MDRQCSTGGATAVAGVRNEKLRVACTKQTQRATFDISTANHAATTTQLDSLKALSTKVLERNKDRNSGATAPDLPRNFSTQQPHKKLREVARVADQVAHGNEGMFHGKVESTGRAIADEFGVSLADCLALLDDDDRQAIATGNDPDRAKAWRAVVHALMAQGLWEAPTRYHDPEPFNDELRF
jgi:hypothetical protein